ncbi:MAG: hypothetical protein HY226_06430 [Candidatus Vogelbacteria bacterium]|nr:hypothetical protein [Candidatus Vogelbacteria bacterium]
MEKLLTKNVLISILVGILIVAGAFWSRLADTSTKELAVSAEDSGAQISYQKPADITTQNVQSDDSQANSSDNNPIKVADLPNVNGLNTPAATTAAPDPNQIAKSPAFIAAQKFWLTPGPSTVPYEQITDKTTIYPNGIEKYKKTDLKTFDTNRASLIAYGKILTKTLSGYPYYTDKTPTEITLDLSKQFSDQDIASLEQVKSAYAKTATNLLAITVPSELSNLHLSLANSFDRTAQLIGSMEKITSDKLLAMNSARQYVEESKLTISILLGMNTYYKDNNVDLGTGNKLSTNVQILN